MKITIREPGSAITHFVAMLLAAGASIPLLLKASGSGAPGVAAMLIFILSMILLYGASAAYHTVTLSERVIRVFRKVDHAMIFVLIAGSYTPVCMLVLEPRFGMPLLIAVWACAAVGIGVKIFWIHLLHEFTMIDLKLG